MLPKPVNSVCYRQRLFRGLPLKLMMTMGLGSLFRPRTRGWGPARAAIEVYVQEQEAEQRRALGLDGGAEETE